VRASIGDLRLTFKLFWLVPSRTFAFGTYRRAFVAPRQPFMALPPAEQRRIHLQHDQGKVS